MSKLTLTPIIAFAILSFVAPTIVDAASASEKKPPAKQMDPDVAAKPREERRLRILEKYDTNRNGKLDADERKRFQDDIAAEKAARDAKAAKKK